MAYQVSIFLENKPGHFRRVTTVLSQADINIRAMTLSTTTLGWGVLNLVVDNPEKACQALQENGHSAALREIIVLEMEDIPGGLDKMLSLCEQAGINIENAYGRIVQEGQKAFLVIDSENIHEAEEKLLKIGLTPLPDSAIYGTKRTNTQPPTPNP